MESFGAKLKAAREARGIDLDRASIETHISFEYLDGLEKEKITLLPGETYLTGFLRNYAEYLNLNPEELVSIYQAYKKQLSPAPLDLLLEPKKKISWYLVAAVSLAVTLIIATIVLVITVNSRRIEAQKPIVIAVPESAVYQLEGIPIQKRVYSGDKIEVKIKDEIIPLTVLETLNTLTLGTPTGNQIIELGEEFDIDLDGQLGDEMTIFLSDISRNDATRGAEVQLMLINQELASVTESVHVQEETIVPEEEIVVPLLASETTESGLKRTVVFEGGTAYPVSLNASFRSPCLFRYEIDRKTTVENYISAGESVNISANNGFRIWMSNANVVNLQIIGGGKTVDLAIGRAGQVVVEDIKWIKDDDGKYKLVVMDVE